ncbi:nuclear transport factor 2 family protein [Phenylobacterium sp.]|uniref:nuclear transport factor 2 family protein n=1 Tax=Phenylobacterium sp. TaxID=1871053 RepID=UPI002FC9DE5E
MKSPDKEPDVTLIQRFIAQRAAFEAAYVSGDWAPLGVFFHEDITYEVMNMPFHCVIKGRASVLSGLERSVERFDKLCIRTVGIDSSIQEEGANVLVHSGMRFERDGAPSTSARLWEIATYRDGLIERIIDIYDPGTGAEFERWMAGWGQGLDPSYV